MTDLQIATRQVESASAIDSGLLESLIHAHRQDRIPRYARLWKYYRNPDVRTSSGRVVAAQADGLPARLRMPAGDPGYRGASAPEIVLENDIAWRIHTMVDFMFGKPIRIVSEAEDERLRSKIEEALERVWELSGGVSLLQDAALLAHVYGHVDLMLRIGETGSYPVIEIIEPARGIPVSDSFDYRRFTSYIVHFERELAQIDRDVRTSFRLFGAMLGGRKREHVTEIVTRDVVEQRRDGKVVARWRNELGFVPVVHIQNQSQPFRYEGISEVEQLIGLQDELNTRLSDRASRVTMQSFKMYLAKGIEGFDKVPVGPGQVWSTDNEHAEIVAFGGDASSPSEDKHIEDVREAMDKVSAVPPVAGGVVRAKIGNLSSANALRVTLLGLLSKTARKRVVYGRGISEMSQMVLASLDTAGVLRTSERDRSVRVVWRDPLPDDIREQEIEARTKQSLGVSDEQIQSELGYADADPGVQ
ncbi:MAG: phage portal protein [Phycisphaeraceae bacterium]|nr:phage portal protein [Phycisphaerales bacterium]MCB9859851.1 phage portal protein [Phycisphaeraceae bacterium]